MLKVRHTRIRTLRKAPMGLPLMALLTAVVINLILGLVPGRDKSGTTDEDQNTRRPQAHLRAILASLRSFEAERTGLSSNASFNSPVARRADLAVVQNL